MSFLEGPWLAGRPRSSARGDDVRALPAARSPAARSPAWRSAREQEPGVCRRGLGVHEATHGCSAHITGPAPPPASAIEGAPAAPAIQGPHIVTAPRATGSSGKPRAF
jgi:hypothetical protein